MSEQDKQDGRRVDERQYTLKEIQDSHREIARLLVMGMKHVDIAHELGVTPAMVSYTANSPVVIREIENMRAARDLDAIDVAKRIQEIAPAALNMLEDLMEKGADETRRKIAESILDRAGHGAVKNVNVYNSRTHLSKDDIIDIQARAKRIGLCIPNEIEAEYVT